MRRLLAAAALLLTAAAASAQDLEQAARLLVDHPLAAHGDRDAAARDALGLVRDAPGHPLAEAALRLLELQLGDVDDPRALATQVMALDPAALRAAGLSPMAGRQLQRLLALTRVAFEPAGALGTDLFPEHLARLHVLGPLPAAGDPLRLGADLPQFADPGFEREHPGRGVGGGAGAPLRWQPLSRSPLRPCVMAESVVDAAEGWALLAASFDAPGGPALLEVETSAAGGAAFAIGTAGTDGLRGRGTTPFAGGGDIAARAYALALNGEPALVVDPRGLQAGALRQHPVVLRRGHNRVLISVPLGEHTACALRVLGPDGWPLAGLAEERPGGGLGLPLDAEPPAAPPCSVDLLAAVPDLAPDAQALRGLLLFLDGQAAEGLAHVRAACERAPGRPGLLAIQARILLRAGYLPDSWRRNRARALIEELLAADPLRMDMAQYLASLVEAEDREADAVASLVKLADALPGRSDPLLQLAGIYRGLDMEAQAESALRRALARTPSRPEALRRTAEHLGRHGQRTQAAVLELEALRSGGSGGRALEASASRLAELGRGAEALDLLREAVARDDAPSLKLALAGQLANLQRDAEADALLAALAATYPRWAEPCRLRADLAGRRGDAAAERARLLEARARDPSQRPTRERLAALGEPDPAEALFAEHAVDLAAARREYVEGDSGDSLVKLVDAAAVYVWPDGSHETLTQDLYHVRDLQGCEQLGELRLSGDVLHVATWKRDGSEHEPVRVGGAYVMPSLEPGDFVVAVTREVRPAPQGGALRIGAWYFASEELPFRLSRYVLRLPASLGLREERRNLAGVVTQRSEPDADGAVHVYEARDQARVLGEPGAPPRSRWLAWVEWGQDADVAAHVADLAAGMREPALVTPEVREAAARASAGLSGDEARARALHALVNQTLDRRGRQGATAALLGREGNGAFLYAALLEAAGVPHELVWSRGVAPAADPEPQPPFAEAGHWSNKLLLLVRPADGPEAWCDLDAETLPYGRLVHDAPGAEALALPSRRTLTLPDVPPDGRPTFDFELDLTLAADGSAQVLAAALPRGGLQWAFKESLRQAPEPLLKSWVQGLLASVVPRLDLQSHELAGLHDGEQPLHIAGAGRVPAFLDDDGHTLSCRLPVPPLELSRQLAGGEGRRHLPYLLGETVTQATVVRLRLPPELAAPELPEPVDLSFRGGSYRLAVEREGGSLLVRRVVAIPPLQLEAAEHADFAAFCARIDEAERGRLRLRRETAVDPPQAPR